MPIGRVVARFLDLPLDVLIVRKLGLPEQPELAIGAVGSGGLRVLNESVLDDGVATGSTMPAGIRSLRTGGPSRIVAAVPVGAPDTIASLREEVDEIVCLLWAISLWYDEFPQVSDEEVRALLEDSRFGTASRRLLSPVVPTQAGPRPEPPAGAGRRRHAPGGRIEG